MKNEIKLFESKKVRSVWDESCEEWYLSVVDIIMVLTDQDDYQKAKNYWKWLKNKLKSEGSELVSDTNQLKLEAEDGKKYKTDVMTPKQLLRLIQSVPSKKAEPFKLWLAEVGNDRLNEQQDPELSLERAMYSYKNLGYSDNWIKTRLQSIEMRKELTDEWDRTGVKKNDEYAILTNVLTQGWSGKNVREYKSFKGLKKENLRDNMTSLELALNILAEQTAAEISRNVDPEGFKGQIGVAKQGGSVANNARRDIEQRTGKPVISPKNANQISGRKTNKGIGNGQSE